MDGKRIGKDGNGHQELGPAFAFEVECLELKAVGFHVLEAVLDLPAKQISHGDLPGAVVCQAGHQKDQWLFGVCAGAFCHDEKELNSPDLKVFAKRLIRLLASGHLALERFVTFPSA